MRDLQFVCMSLNKLHGVKFYSRSKLLNEPGFQKNVENFSVKYRLQSSLRFLGERCD